MNVLEYIKKLTDTLKTEGVKPVAIVKTDNRIFITFGFAYDNKKFYHASISKHLDFKSVDPMVEIIKRFFKI